MKSVKTAYTEEQLISIFQGAVSEEMFEKIRSLDPPLYQESEERVATVFFCDIAGANDLINKMGAESARLTISEMLIAVSNESMQRSGYVDKYVGDEAMIIFGAPFPTATRDQALAAAETSVAVCKRASELSLEIGIGFNTGPMEIGNYATEKKAAYTPFGDAVNFASLLEWYSRMGGNRGAISESVRQIIKDAYRTVFLTTTQPRHFFRTGHSFDVYAVIARHDDLTIEEVAVWDRYDKAISMITDGRTAEAITLLHELVTERPEDRLFQTGLERARAIYAERSAQTYRDVRGMSALLSEVRNAVSSLFGEVSISLLEKSIEGVWRFHDDTGLTSHDRVYAPSGEAIIWLRGLQEAEWIENGPEHVRSLEIGAVVPLRKDNEFVGALFVDCAPGTDLTSLSVLGSSLADPWLTQYNADVQNRYRKKVDDAEKLEELIRELEAKSIALENTLEENKELNRTLEKRVEEHAARLERAASLKRYLPPQVVDEIIGGGRELSAQTERRKLTILFSDVQGFTAATDRLEPEELSRLLNGYLSAMSEIAFEAGATIDKFRGDGMMVFFGAPEKMEPADAAKRCLSMATRMCRKVAQLREEWFNEGYDWELGIRIGINTGYATVGEFGSSDRLDYTAIGTEVNIASRLESVCETDKILISHSTWALVNDAFTCAELGSIDLKGINRKIRTYTVEY